MLETDDQWISFNILHLNGVRISAPAIGNSLRTSSIPLRCGQNLKRDKKEKNWWCPQDLFSLQILQQFFHLIISSSKYRCHSLFFRGLILKIWCYRKSLSCPDNWIRQIESDIIFPFFNFHILKTLKQKWKEEEKFSVSLILFIVQRLTVGLTITCNVH